VVEPAGAEHALVALRQSAEPQHAALGMGGTGVVEVKVEEGPMYFAGHAVGFTTYGTVVRSTGDHTLLRPLVILTLDDPVVTFDASTLSGG